MKSVIFFVFICLSQLVFATGGVGEDPNLARSAAAEAGSTFTSAVGKSDQPAFCEKCEERTGVMLSNSKGTLTTTTPAPEGSGTPGKPVKTGQ